MNADLGFAGKIAREFINSKLTLLFIIVALIMGVFAIYKTPKEEEPQIKVPMIDVLVPVPGYSPEEVEKRVTNLIEKEMTTLLSIKHVYSTSLENAALVTIRFEVGEDLENSLVKVHHKMMGLRNILPKEALNPIIKSYTIDDVPFYTITFYSEKYNSSEIRYKIVPLTKELQEINGISDLTYIGGERKVLKIIPDLKRLDDLGVTLIELKDAVEKSDSAYAIGPIRERSPEPIMAVGSFSKNITDIANIPIGHRYGKSIKLGDVAKIVFDYDLVRTHVSYGKEMLPAVTIAYAKKKGTNATILAEKIQAKLTTLTSLPDFDKNIKYEITRDYGFTAKEKSNELLEHLLIATISVMVLIAITMGIRVSLVVGIAVPVTLAMTIFIYYLLGYTLNRVTLFALIFSIGILVDDAIVVVENIYRHLSLRRHKQKDIAIIAATDEVGNPTILATLTVIMAIMPMAFVGGLMGPYMRPIPIGASLAMLFSLFIAFIISPWAGKRIIKESSRGGHHNDHDDTDGTTEISDASSTRKDGIFARTLRGAMSWTISKKINSIIVAIVVILMLSASFSLVTSKLVKVKMLPFDNKSEFQILVDLHPGTNLDQTKAFMREMIGMLYNYPEVKNVQTYIGTAAPYNFSGMVKHSFMRSSSYRADIQVNLLDKNLRKIQSHELVNKVRSDLNKKYSSLKDVKIKLLEIPPGPPVLSTLLAEIYYPDKELQKKATIDLAEIYRNTGGVVETDTTIEVPQKKILYDFNRSKGMVHGVPQSYATSTVLMALADLNIFQMHLANEEEPVFMRMSLRDQIKSSDEKILSLTVPSVDGDKVPLKKVMDIQNTSTISPIYHKNLKTVSYVMAEVAGEEESPFYAILKMQDKLPAKFNVTYTDIPSTSKLPTLKWDGEMDITLEVFRDLGVAFCIALILIMILVIGWYNSFTLPLIIILPIPLTLIGILPGHYLMNSFFTATSMIGFIAGAGITVRNSIILVDFIEMKRSDGSSCMDAVIDSTIIRFRPILLTAMAVLVAGFVIIFDPIFQGLAISLMAGSIVSALLSIPLVPVLYYWIAKNKTFVVRTINKEVSL
ncbi:MAG: efflux RND transporter permease subunit [Oligoflexia bacterium]|nr:efflux RND transporter permease subunit [Oligoflexia bacterium]